MKTNELQHEIMCCTGCGFCKKSCPTYHITGKETDSGKGKVLLAYGLLTGEIKEDASVVEALQNCPLCRRCEYDCPSLIHIDEIISTVRKELRSMLPAHKKIVNAITQTGNPFKQKMIKGTPGGDIAYFAGCVASYKEKNIKHAALMIFEKLGIEVTLLDAVCCGNPLESIGRENSTLTLIKKEIKNTSIKKIVFSCPNCMQSFKPLSKHYELMHFSQFLSQYPLTMKPFSKNIIYHDSSILGRYHGIYDEPRMLLRTIGPFFEFNEKQEVAKCCGSDMGFERAFPELAAQMAEKIWDEAREKNALIVTGSPHCYTHLKKYGEVMDITELIDKLL